MRRGGRGSEIERFFAKVEVDASGCWFWNGSRTAGGYGQFWREADQRLVAAHRWAYERWISPIPDGLQLDHLCRVRCCVNPDHVEPVTQAENIRRGEGGSHWRAKTHCPKGHPYDEENTGIWQGRRNCRICNRAAQRRAYWRARRV